MSKQNTSQAKKNKLSGYGTTVKKVLGYLKAYKFLFALSLLLAIGIVAGTLYIPILVGDAIDLAVDVGRVDFDGIFKILMRIGVVTLMTALLQWIMGIINSIVAQKISEDVRNEAFEKLHHDVGFMYLLSSPDLRPSVLESTSIQTFSARDIIR